METILNEESRAAIELMVADGIIAKDVVERYFPELKESGDERTWIINYLSNRILNSTIIAEKENLKKAIAWLEKQGNNMGISEATKQKLEDNLNKALEKETPESWNKFLDEQKSADKVELKFKIEKGKWYVCIKDLLDNYANKAFYEGDIYLSTQDGSLIPSNSNVPFKVVCPDTYFRDWTIQDVKDGDVLSYRNGQWIFILKRRIDKDSFEYYTLWSTIHNDLTINDSAFSLLINSIYPATKEQRDLLFQKIHEAGYEWDSEKKELKKIEQKSAWSEEDEKSVNIILDICSDFKKVYSYSKTVLKDANKIESFLKSLKERVQPQPKQEWSEENEKMLEYAIDIIEWYNVVDKSKSKRVSDWFKSLKPQNRWKPSKKQMNFLKGYAEEDMVIQSLYDDLKKLRGE